jgi:RNA polymerase sigma-70 factor (ECF subfamily)
VGAGSATLIDRAVLEWARARMRTFAADRRRSGSDHAAALPIAPAATVLDACRRRRLEQLLESVDPDTRRIYLMHRLDGLSYRAISDALGVSPSEVETCVAQVMLVLTTP